MDDDAEQRERVRAWLGPQTRSASSADEALAALHGAAAAIAVCDLDLPARDGLWLARRIRERWPATAIVMATALRDVDTAVTGLRNEAVDYLLKPFHRARLEEALALGWDWHRAATSQDGLHDVLQHRLRARRAALAAELAEAQHTPEDALEGLMAMLQLHERDGRGHATRVARLALTMGDELGLRDEELTVLEHGALLHDIGKLDVPASILSKPAPLDDDEWRVMRTHPRVGYDLLSNQPRFADAAWIVLTHHEAYDGSGYPNGLSRRAIPWGSRILAVADAYDSMTQPHTQRPPMPPAMAAAELERCRGTQFDPECVDALGAVLVHSLEREPEDAAV